MDQMAMHSDPSDLHKATRALYVESSAPDDANKVERGISGVEGLRVSVVQAESPSRCGVDDVGGACWVGASRHPDAKT